MATKKTKGTATTTATGYNTMRVQGEVGKSQEQQLAEAVARGAIGNASVMRTFSKATFGDIPIMDCAYALKESADKVVSGDMSGAEMMLMTQAGALNAIFVELSQRAASNMGQYLDAAERYMRLALKAQSQCRATLESLAAIKNPPVVFAKQANINNGGQQQVNNGNAPEPTIARAQETAIEPNKLLEPAHGERMDGRTQGSTGRTHPVVASVGAVDRAKVRSR